MRIAAIALAAAFLLVAGLLAGMASAKLERPPYTWLRDTYLALTGQSGGGASAEFAKVEPAHIRTQSPEQVERVRSELIRLLWGGDELPSRLPDAVERGFSDPAFAELDGVARIDRLTVKMDHGLDSKIHHFIPRRPNGKLVLFHKGHEDGGDFVHNADIIGRLIGEGYSVAAFAMPLLGPNSRPTIQHPRLGAYQLSDHDRMRMLRPESGHPVRYFLEPVAVALNYFDRAYDYSSVAMTGLSGGGWSTVLAAALDPRIGQSFPIAGSLPLNLRTPGGPSDFEQHAPDVYWTATYPELYVLGTSGGRTQLQILNAHDACCFRAAKAELYREPVRAVVRRAGGGCFDVLADDTHRGHAYSPWAQAKVIEAMAAGPQRVARC